MGSFTGNKEDHQKRDIGFSGVLFLRVWKEQRRYAQKSNHYSCDIFHNHGCHENGKTKPDPLRDQCPEQNDKEKRGAIRGGNRKKKKKKGTGLGWHLPCSGIKRILFVVCNKTEIFENFRIFIVK